MPSSVVRFFMNEFELAWLRLVHAVCSAADGPCICAPSSSSGTRWSGYLGANYASSRVLFVGENHNGGVNGLLKTRRMARYNALLLRWAVEARTDEGDDELLTEMRAAYSKSWDAWGAVWNIFGDIRTRVRIGPEDFAFVNLARCPESLADRSWNDDAARACQEQFRLAELVLAIDARIIFLAKGGSVGRSVTIPDEIGLADIEDPANVSKRLVVRYDNGSYGYLRERGTKRHHTAWVPAEAERIRGFRESLTRSL